KKYILRFRADIIRSPGRPGIAGTESEPRTRSAARPQRTANPHEGSPLRRDHDKKSRFCTRIRKKIVSFVRLFPKRLLNLNTI
ncbi:hypothetical protein, partial [Alistipes ihumii]|uniref:hypothetical protein n=1 Tax=Alistipes ihumii TaxID=1470347 RepID=UPI003AF99AEE